MPIKIICPNGHSLTIKGKYAGKKGLCPICKATVEVPLSDAAVLPAYSILSILQMDESGVSIVMKNIPNLEKDLGELVPENGSAPISLRERTLLVGRSKDCDIVLLSSAISRYHALLRVIGSRWCVEDKGSTNGVIVNGRRVMKGWLGPGDTVAFAKHAYKISYSPNVLAALPPLPDMHRTLGELVPVGGGTPIALLKKTLLVGRCEPCDIVLPFATVSRRHAELAIVRDHWRVEDKGSDYGVRINGLLRQRKRLHPGDTVAFGKRSYKIQYDPNVLSALDTAAQDSSTVPLPKPGADVLVFP